MLDALAALVKAVLYLASLSAAGIALAAASLRWPGTVERHALRALRWNAGAMALASIAWAALLVVRLGGEFDPELVPVVFDSGVGAGTALQLGGAVLLLTSAGDDAFTRFWRAASALVVTIAFAFSGHAAAMSPQASLLAFAHTTAAAWWIGSLWMLRWTCASSEPRILLQLVLRFSAVAVAVVGALVVAGVLLIFSLIDFDEPEWFDRYEQMLLVKIGVAVVALSIALFNKVRLTPRLRTDDAGAAPLQRSISVELGVIGAVLAATAVLTTFFSPYE